MIHSSIIDELILHADQAMRSLFAHDTSSERAYPAEDIPHQDLSKRQITNSANLMRINHTGEICAQALYQGQALTATDKVTKQTMQHCAEEELDHLAWCETRLKELGSAPSKLNPLWYASSFVIGVAAGIAGDRWSLGFIKETEDQVVKHLQSHLNKVSKADLKSRAVIETMLTDEQQHADTAQRQGAKALPFAIKQLMAMSSKVMTTLTYYV